MTERDAAATLSVLNAIRTILAELLEIARRAERREKETPVVKVHTDEFQGR